MTFPLDKTDLFLGGRLSVAQGAYRAGADPVFLAASVPARAGQSVLELGVGAGVGLLCLGCRVSGLELVGLERALEAVALARANAARNKLDAEIIEGDVSALPATLLARQFDHVMMNPPFFAVGTKSPTSGRAEGRHEDVDLAVWIDAGVRRLKPGGHLTVIQRTQRVPECLSAIGERLGGLRLRPLAPRAGRAAKLVILSGEKGARAPFQLLPPFVLHEGDSHVADSDSYSEAAAKILRHGEAFGD